MTSAPSSGWAVVVVTATESLEAGVAWVPVLHVVSTSAATTMAGRVDEVCGTIRVLEKRRLEGRRQAADGEKAAS